MAKQNLKCPKCGLTESVMSSRPNTQLPPCSRCPGFVRMVDATPPPGQTTTTWSTAGSQGKEAKDK